MLSPPCVCAFASSLPRANMGPSPNNMTRARHCEEMTVQFRRAHSRTVFISSSSTDWLSPARPSSPSLFTHRQLKPFPSAVIHSNILYSCFFVVIFPFLRFFSPSLFLSCGFYFSGKEVEAGGGTKGRGEEKRRGWWWGYICSFFMSNHMCFWALVFTCHGKKAVEEDDGRRKTCIWFLFVGLNSEPVLFVSCDELREVTFL